MNERRDIVIVWDSPDAVDLATGLNRYIQDHQLNWKVQVVAASDPLQTGLAREPVPVVVARRPLTGGDSAISTRIHIHSQPPDDPGTLHQWFDDDATGREAAVHLLQRGYQAFACISRLDDQVIPAYRRIREQAFADEVKRRGLTCLDRSGHTVAAWTIGRFHAWLRNLPTGTGIFCHEDQSARHLLNELRNVDRTDLGVVGAGDFPFAHGLGLSSVRLSWRLMGHQVARRLHLRFCGSPDLVSAVPPLGVAARASSSTAGRAAWLVRAEAWVRARPDRRQDVGGLARHLGMSRSSLHRHFQAAVGQPARDVLRTWRLNRVREALMGDDQGGTIDALARRHGWSDGPHLIRQFKRAFGITPHALMAAAGPIPPRKAPRRADRHR